MDSNIIKKSQKSADTQLARNLDTVLAMAAAEGRTPTNMEEALYLCCESGYILDNLNPTAEGYYFAWDSATNQILYVCTYKSDLDTVEYPEDYTLDPSSCWITVGDAEEAQKVAQAGYNIYLETSIDKIELHDVAVQVATGENTLGQLVFSGDLQGKSIAFSGTLNDAIDTQNATNFSISSVTGHVNSLALGNNATSVSINAAVGSLSGNSASSISLGSLAKVSSSTSSTKFVDSNNNTVTTKANGELSGAKKVGDHEEVEIGTRNDLLNIRDQVNGGETFKDTVIVLENDIDLSGFQTRPNGDFGRSDTELAAASTTYFQGSYDGNGKTITYSSTGFSMEGLNASTNSTSGKFGSKGVTYNEAIYSLLGAVYVPEGETVTIKNLTVVCDIDLIIDDKEQMVGDSVAGLVGFAYGKGTLRFENVTVKGSIKGYDGVSAFVGRTKGGVNVEFVDCTNMANVTGVRKTGAFIGTSYQTIGSSLGSVTFTNCENTGKIECLGREYDLSIGGEDKGEEGICNGYYIVSQTSPECGWVASSEDGIKYSGSTWIAGKEVTEENIPHTGAVKINKVK